MMHYNWPNGSSKRTAADYRSGALTRSPSIHSVQLPRGLIDCCQVHTVCTALSCAPLSLPSCSTVPAAIRMKYYAHLPNMTAPSHKIDRLESVLMIVRCAGASSVINILKDGRWGRAPETYGECPVLTADVAVAFNKVCAAQLLWLVSASLATRLVL